MYGNCLDYLTVNMEDVSVLSLRKMGADPYLRHLVALDAAVSGSYHCYDNPTPDIPKCMFVGLPPLGDEADGQAPHQSIHLCAKQSIN